MNFLEVVSGAGSLSVVLNHGLVVEYIDFFFSQ